MKTSPRYIKTCIFLSLILLFVQTSLHSSLMPSQSSFDYAVQKESFWTRYLHGETLKVCRYNATEAAGSGEYAIFYEKGTYYCACCGGDFALFLSKAKYDSGTGWPSFYEAIPGAVIERPDPNDRIRALVGLARTEVLCARCHSHLGHVFDDGPKPSGKRYCMNSAALTFTKFGQKPKRTYELARNDQRAVFAMGCFWCAEAAFQDAKSLQALPGILSLQVGYAGGTGANPSYEHHEGYKEALEITFDPKKIAYRELLKIFWKNIDPLDGKGQFCDKGFAYTSAIFYQDPSQKQDALDSLTEIQASLTVKDVIKTELIPYTSFYEAEEYHQNYKQKNPIRYAFYRWNCSRDQRLQAVWGK